MERYIYHGQDKEFLSFLAVFVTVSHLIQYGCAVVPCSLRPRGQIERYCFFDIQHWTYPFQNNNNISHSLTRIVLVSSSLKETCTVASKEYAWGTPWRRIDELYMEAPTLQGFAYVQLRDS
ncbi:uncharacterized protein Gasu_51160 [Galdieria sulphuraria]|uniref:Uncharacterized protein n=1 Tax=Galdieria sulphuraria TaxID=130081 RepID=M2VVK6_GALSU|nr:uncharacterized protein Gasu_51160 [Galdieria sulphuraria]EME27256.1 hypothetical protein Gasu_51160 [Galdieria sulphuraria]|eukprot:XP_005703776.1 hypothetical protein Gasu_51160 [Galdieria sulphuraria]